MNRLLLLLSLLFFTINNLIAQITETVSDNIYVDFRSNSKSEIEILKPSSFTKSRAFAPESSSGVTRIEGIVTDEEGVKSLKVNQQEILVLPGGRFEKLVMLTGLDSIHFEVVDNHDKLEIISFSVSKPINSSFAVHDRVLGEVGEYYALLIGVNEYEESVLSDLDNPISDMESITEVLQKNYTFKEDNIVQLTNAKRRDIINALDQLSSRVTARDNLLIFYAGHGYWDSKSEVGYWIPSDGKRNSKAEWFRNSTLRDYLKELNTKHTLLVADACFAGGIFKAREVSLDYNESTSTRAVRQLYQLNSRKAMTSGTLTKVPDKSVFTKYLVKRLKDNTKKYLPASELFHNLRLAVINNSNVVPQFGTIQNVGDEGGGDFIFIRK